MAVSLSFQRDTRVARLQPTPSLPTPVAVLFDLDGTLIDTMDVFADVAADVMASHHRMDRRTARAAYLTTSGIPFFQQLEVIAPRDERNVAAAAEFERRKVEATRDVQPDPDAIEALTALRAEGIRVGVCSNNFQHQVDKFAAACPVPLDLALGFGAGLAKGPSHFARACATFGCTLDALVFVGDSLADAELARGSGVRFVAKLGTFGADAFLDLAPHAPAIGDLRELGTLFS
jgi:phosphoglycolate phosphatase-like HAD superfamily hydrolase